MYPVRFPDMDTKYSVENHIHNPTDLGTIPSDMQHMRELMTDYQKSLNLLTEVLKEVVSR